jgi:chain length determinant protein (polysaccharide antigen chain regulator)
MDKVQDDEIDLLSLIQTIWEGKWKILSIMAIFLLSVLGFNTVFPNTTFNAQTEIKPITSFEFDKYRLFNASLKKFDSDNKEVKIFNISKEILLTLYIEQIEEGTLLETGIDKFELINKDDFENDIAYKEAIQKFASEIEILRPINVDRKTKGEIRLNHVLSATYDDEDKWKKLISFVDIEANKRVKEIITNRFKSILSVEEQTKNFSKKDIDIAIENVKEDYEMKTKGRLAFLSEQAAIARKLGIKKNTIESQMFDTQNTVVTSFKTDTPFYLRGYEAIEEEINLIKGRKNKSPFMEDLFKLQKEKRKLEQDETLNRAKVLLNKTPLTENDFKATLFKVAATNFELNNKRNLYYALALVLGGMIGVVFVLIVNAFKIRQDIESKS